MMKNNPSNPKLYINTVYKVIETQSAFLPTQTQALIKELNRIAERVPSLIEKHQPSCFILQNTDEVSFDLVFGLRDHNKELIFFDDYKLNFNDGKSFGLNDYPLEIAEHPTEDLFNLFRLEVLEKLFYIWLTEGIWNSKLVNLSIPLLYTPNFDYDKLINTRNSWEYDNFDFLDQ